MIHYRVVATEGLRFHAAGYIVATPAHLRSHVGDRTLLVQALRWGEVAYITGEAPSLPYNEWFIRGSVALSDRPVFALGHVPLGGKAIGRTLGMFDDDEGLFAYVDVDESPGGDWVLDQVDRGTRLPTSIGFVGKPKGYRIYDGHTPGVRREAVTLAEIAVVDAGAYKSSHVKGRAARPSNMELAARSAARLPELAVRHLPGLHDQKSHGNWAKKAVKAVAAISDLLSVPSDVRKSIFDGYKAQPKGQLLHSPAADSFDNLVAVAHVYGGKVPGGISTKLAAQIVDEQLSKNQGVANHQLLEKKLIDWLATSDGKKYALANTKPKKLIVDSLTGKVTAPSGVKLLPGQKVQKLGGPGKFNASQIDFSGHTAAQMQKLQDGYMAANGIKWSSAQRTALENYAGGGYTAMNNYLRGKHTTSNSLTKTQILDVQSAMMPLQENARLVRGADWDQLPTGFQNLAAAKKLVGKTIQEPAFMSTSVAGAGGYFSHKAIKLIIEAPTGTLGVFVKSISLHPSENEFLLAAGQKFRVMEVASAGGTVTIRLRVVTPK